MWARAELLPVLVGPCAHTLRPTCKRSCQNSMCKVAATDNDSPTTTASNVADLFKGRCVGFFWSLRQKDSAVHSRGHAYACVCTASRMLPVWARKHLCGYGAVGLGTMLDQWENDASEQLLYAESPLATWWKGQKKSSVHFHSLPSVSCVGLACRFNRVCVKSRLHWDTLDGKDFENQNVCSIRR